MDGVADYLWILMFVFKHDAVKMQILYQDKYILYICFLEKYSIFKMN